MSNIPFTDKATPVVHVSGVTFYEHPEHGDEAPVLAHLGNELIDTERYLPVDREELTEWVQDWAAERVAEAASRRLRDLEEWLEKYAAQTGAERVADEYKALQQAWGLANHRRLVNHRREV